MCRSVLQYIAVCCNVLQCVAAFWNCTSLACSLACSFACSFSSFAACSFACSCMCVCVCVCVCVGAWECEHVCGWERKSERERAPACEREREEKSLILRERKREKVRKRERERGRQRARVINHLFVFLYLLFLPNVFLFVFVLQRCLGLFRFTCVRGNRCSYYRRILPAWRACVDLEKKKSQYFGNAETDWKYVCGTKACKSVVTVNCFSPKYWPY